MNSLLLLIGSMVAALTGLGRILTVSISGGFKGGIVGEDSSQNVYTSAFATTLAGTFLAKYNSSGVIQWQRVFGAGSIGDLENYGIAVNSAGDVFLVGSIGFVLADAYICKYNTSGVLQWQRKLSSTSAEFLHAVALDSSSNLYAVGTSNISGTVHSLLVKYASSGAIQWQKVLTGTSTKANFGVIATSAGVVYCCGYWSSSAITSSWIITKHDSSGALQWQKAFPDYATLVGGFVAYGIAVDSSENVYVVGDAMSNNEAQIVKYNSSGVLQWQRALYVSGGGNLYTRAVALDTAGNVYMVGALDVVATALKGAFVIKYNASGVIQWQRLIQHAGLVFARDVVVSLDGLHVYVSGTVGSGTDAYMLAQITVDGDPVGPHAPYTYAVSSLVSYTSTYADSTSALVNAVSTLTDSAGTLSDSTASATTTTTLL